MFNRGIENMASYGDIVSRSLKFSLHPKRWLQFFVVDAILYAIAAQLVISNLPNFAAFLASVEVGVEVALSVMSFIGIVIAVFAVFWLVRMWIQGAMIQQSANEKAKIAGTFRYGLRRYVSLLLATIIVGVIGYVVGVVPFIGWLLTLVVSIVLLFTAQAVMVSKLGFADALKGAYAMFRRRPGSVFLAWLATALVSLIITGIFLLPAFAVFGAVLLPVLAGAGTSASMVSLITAVLQNIGLLVVVGLVFLVGSSIAATFGVKALTEFYVTWKKKKMF